MHALATLEQILAEITNNPLKEFVGLKLYRSMPRVVA